VNSADGLEFYSSGKSGKILQSDKNSGIEFDLEELPPREMSNEV
jgi:hypothetical protein